MADIRKNSKFNLLTLSMTSKNMGLNKMMKGRNSVQDMNKILNKLEYKMKQSIRKWKLQNKMKPMTEWKYYK